MLEKEMDVLEKTGQGRRGKIHKEGKKMERNEEGMAQGKRMVEVTQRECQGRSVKKYYEEV